MAATTTTTLIPTININYVLEGIGQPMWSTSAGATYYYFGATAKTSQCNAITQKPSYKPLFHYRTDESPTHARPLDNTCIKGWVRYYELIFPTTCWKSYRDNFWKSNGNTFYFRPHSDKTTAFSVYIAGSLLINTNKLNNSIDKIIVMQVESISMISSLPNART